MLPSISLNRSLETPPADVLTRGQAAGLLGLSLNTVSKLLDSGFLPDLQAHRVLAISRSPHVTVTEGVLPVLRAAAAAPPTDAADGRAFLGDGAALSDQEFAEANRQWWRCDPQLISSSGLIAVAVAGWVTGVLAVRGVDETVRFGRDEIRYSFHTEVAGRVGALDDPRTFRVLAQDSPLREVTGRLLGARVHAARSGGPIAYLAPLEDR